LRFSKPNFWGIHASPSRKLCWFLGLLPFLLLLACYLLASDIRHEQNPQDKILPHLSEMANSFSRLCFERDSRTGELILLSDTLASLQRLGIGVSIAALAGLLIGMNMGIFRGMAAVLLPVTTFVSIIPPLAILPILFITFGVEELSKVMLIILGIAPTITRDVFEEVRSTSQEQITKALTLGASQLELVYKVILPQVMPKLIETIRLSLGSAWLFLIASEAIASSNGLGYRIFLVRRYLAMDVIIPYALWITFLGFLMDTLLKWFLRWQYPWYQNQK
jgi:NitT/TauT family transport system permease protein